MSRASKTTLWALASLLATAVIAAPAQAKRFQVTGQQTVVTPSTQVTQFLATHGITVTTVGRATSSNGSWTFPIVRGHVAVPAMRGVLVHRGGLRFTQGAKSITLRHFVVRRTRGRALLSVRAGGRVLPLARVENAKVSVSGTTGTVTGELILTPAAALAINHRLGDQHAVAAGADLGGFTSTVTVA